MMCMRQYINHDDTGRACDVCRVVEVVRGRQKFLGQHLPGTKRRITAVHKTQRVNGMNSGNFRQVRGKVTGRCSPSRVLTSTNFVSRTLTPSCHHVAGERCLSFASKHLTCLIWSNHPAVNLLRAIRLFYSLLSTSFPLSLSFIVTLELSLAYRSIGIRVHLLHVDESSSW